MRTQIFILFVFFAGVIMLMTNSCKKNEKTTNVIMESQPAANNPQDLKLIRMFTAFKEKVNKKLKDDQEITTDSAMWYLQGTANFTYGTASQQTTKIVIDSTFITLSLSNKKVTLTETCNKYSDMIDSIRASYNKITGNQKQLMMVQVQPHLLTSSVLTCKVTSIFCNGGYPYDTCSFNSIDSWIWWNWSGQGGICGGLHSGQGNGFDAAQLINQKIMHCKGIPIGYYYWGEPVTIELWPWNYPNPAWGGVNHNYEEYRMYWNDSEYSGFHGCLSPTECNFYLSGTQWVATTYQSQGGAMPDYKGLVAIAIHGDEVNDVPNYGDSEYLHHGPAYYGTMHFNTVPATALN